MSIFIVDDSMIDTVNFGIITISTLSIKHIKTVNRRFCEMVESIVYVGRGDECKILKDRYVSRVEILNGRIFDKSEFKHYIKETTDRYVNLRTE